jgi:para-nitrobenzyl esterase
LKKRKGEKEMKRWRFITIAVIILVCFGLVATAGAKGTFKTVVKTKYGKVEGYVDEDYNTVVWKGIPYAKEPERWKAPQDPERWKGVRPPFECEPCAQMGTDPITWEYLGPIGSEDCLYLNIYRPASKEKKLPVYVWIHGGSNNYGSIKNYNGSVIASRGNMVVVTVQYRLGPFGWLTHPALRNDATSAHWIPSKLWNG